MTSFNEVVTTFLLIRHGSTDYVGKALAGRMPGVSLDAAGRIQAQELATRLAGRKIRAIYSSPLERATETAGPLSEHLGLPITIRESLTEIDFGQWQGRSLAQLQGNEQWDRFNGQRGHTSAPGGELMLEVQSRMARELACLQREHPEQTVALFSHADVIKAAVLMYLEAPLDSHLRLEISPASVSVLELAEWGPRIVTVNG